MRKGGENLREMGGQNYGDLCQQMMNRWTNCPNSPIETDCKQLDVRWSWLIGFPTPNTPPKMSHTLPATLVVAESNLPNLLYSCTAMIMEEQKRVPFLVAHFKASSFTVNKLDQQKHGAWEKSHMGLGFLSVPSFWFGVGKVKGKPGGENRSLFFLPPPPTQKTTPPPLEIGIPSGTLRRRT